MKIGFIGIGVMGESMARHLMQKGHGLTVFNRTKAKAETLLKEGAAWAESAGACAREQDAVITIVGFPSDVEEVYLGQGGIVENAKPGAFLIDMTTTSPALWQRIAQAAVERGMRPLDAPVSGGDTGARNAPLSIPKWPIRSPSPARWPALRRPSATEKPAGWIRATCCHAFLPARPEAGR